MGCLWRKPEPPQSRAPLLSDVQREEPHCSLSSPVLAPRSWHWEGLQRGWALMSPNHGLPHAPLPQSVDPCALRQPLEQTPMNGPQTQMELKAQLSPRVKEENLKSLLTAAQTMFLHLPQTLSTQSLQSI